MIAGYKAKATATYSFSSNATNQCNTTHQNAHSHKWVDEPATKKKKKKAPITQPYNCLMTQ